MIQKGYQHRDLSIGNMVMINKAVKTKHFEIIKKQEESAMVEDITKMLQELKIKPSATWGYLSITTIPHHDSNSLPSSFTSQYWWTSRQI
jgi:hypothetical protein